MLQASVGRVAWHSSIVICEAGAVPNLQKFVGGALNVRRNCTRWRVESTQRMNRIIPALGSVLVLGGLAHFYGVTRLYLSEGLPDANRILLDVWIGETQVVAGAFYITAYRALRRDVSWRPWAIAGAVTVLACTVPFLPVLFSRAPIAFRVAPAAYAVVSAVILWKATTRQLNGEHT
jgi:uncharacterized membrane protein HdeD (DUF308 family)